MSLAVAGALLLGFMVFADPGVFDRLSAGDILSSIRSLRS
jgi:hypothetical protein